MALLPIHTSPDLPGTDNTEHVSTVKLLHPHLFLIPVNSGTPQTHSQLHLYFYSEFLVTVSHFLFRLLFSSSPHETKPTSTEKGVHLTNDCRPWTLRTNAYYTTNLSS